MVVCIYIGDFFNGAQVIIDTFISSGETKWTRQSGLVLLLPTGMEGTGPEHSSCRTERFLQLSDDKMDKVVNMHIVNCTTPSQYFHVLRRQMKRNYRKPLIVATPKYLLRYEKCQSDLKEMSEHTQFQPILQDDVNKPDITRILFCSGRIYYDLQEEMTKRSIKNTAIIRIEEICPFPYKQLIEVSKSYKNCTHYNWVQEEHKNQGCWSFVEPRLKQALNRDISYVGRDTSASVATGVSKHHKLEVAQLFDAIFHQ